MLGNPNLLRRVIASILKRHLRLETVVPKRITDVLAAFVGCHVNFCPHGVSIGNLVDELLDSKRPRHDRSHQVCEYQLERVPDIMTGYIGMSQQVTLPDGIHITFCRCPAEAYPIVVVFFQDAQALSIEVSQSPMPKNCVSRGLHRQLHSRIGEIGGKECRSQLSS